MAQVNGMQGTPVFTHNVVDWENEEQKYKVQLMKQEFYAIAQLMKWVDGDMRSRSNGCGEIGR